MDDENKIELDIKLELKDHLRANYWFIFSKWSMKILVVMAVFLTLLFIIIFILNPTAGFFPILIMPVFVLFLLGNIYWSTKRNLASHKALQNSIHYTFSNEGISAVTKSSSGHTSWENILKAHETKHNFLLFASRILIYVIPKRCFQSPTQLTDFKQMLVNHLGSKAKLK